MNVFGSSSGKYTPANISEYPDPTRTPIRRRPWRPGFFRRLPWAGVLSILLALGCAVAAVSVGLASDGQPLDYWSIRGYAVQPAVLLSIFATVANALLVFAFTQGATIHWWNTAFQGATLKQLHSSYHYGSGLIAVFSSVTSFNTVAVAGLLMPVLLMDGPLLQRASNVVQRTHETWQNSTIPVTSSPFMQGVSGIMTDHESSPSLYHPLFAGVLRQYENRDPILFPNGTCNGFCNVEIIAPGWDISCEESSKDFTLATYYDQQDAFQQQNVFPNGSRRANSTYDGPKLTQQTFDISVLYNSTMANLGTEVLGAYGYHYGVELQVSYKSTPGGNYTLVQRTCQLMEAMVKYPLKLVNGTATLRRMPVAENRTVGQVYRQSESGGQGDSPSTIGGFRLALQSHYETRATMNPVGGWYAIRATNPIASTYLRAPNASAITGAEVTWADPMDDMILMAHELAFRTALTTSSEVPGTATMGADYNFYNLTTEQPYIISPNLTEVNRTISQSALVKESRIVTVYATQKGWLAGGFVVICLAILAIVPTYWGWWRLGREVSMSPLEIARAFNAPILRDADPNATGDDLKRDLGSVKVCLALGGGEKGHESGSYAMDDLGRSTRSLTRSVG